MKSAVARPINNSPSCLLLCLSLEFVVGHGDNGEDKIDEVEGAQQDVEDEKQYVHGPVCHQCNLI